jgi:5-formyltetrahydrofolate cyclo-ligase
VAVRLGRTRIDEIEIMFGNERRHREDARTRKVLLQVIVSKGEEGNALTHEFPHELIQTAMNRRYAGKKPTSWR